MWLCRMCAAVMCAGCNVVSMRCLLVPSATGTGAMIPWSESKTHHSLNGDHNQCVHGARRASSTSSSNSTGASGVCMRGISMHCMQLSLVVSSKTLLQSGIARSCGSRLVVLVSHAHDVGDSSYGVATSLCGDGMHAAGCLPIPMRRHIELSYTYTGACAIRLWGHMASCPTYCARRGGDPRMPEGVFHDPACTAAANSSRESTPSLLRSALAKAVLIWSGVAVAPGYCVEG